MRALGRGLAAVLLLAVLAMPALAAESFTVDTTAVRSAILPGESAEYALTLTNTESFAQRFSVSSLESSFILFLEPQPGVIAANASQTVALEISPRSSVRPGSHRVPLRARSLTSDESEDFSVLLGVRDPSRDYGVYVPSIALSVGVPDGVDPREDLTLRINLRNRNARQYGRADPVTVTITSDLFERSYDTQLGGVGDDGEKTSEVPIELDPHQAPGTHPLTVTLTVGNQTVSTEETRFTIIPVEDVTVADSAERVLFKTTTTYRVVNEGNVEQVSVIEYPVNPLERLFVTSSHNYEVVGGLASIPVTVQPEEEVFVTMTENYRLLVLLIILAILSGIGYYLLRSPVVVGKEATVSAAPKEGSSEVTVRVFLKNRSSSTLRNLRVVDRISGMADISKEMGLGTLRPTKVVKKKGQGTLLRWDLDQLEPFEERIITYKATTSLQLVGDLQLPAAKVKYDVSSGRERTSHSNEVNVKR